MSANALVLAMLVFAPLIFGGNRPLPLLVLELIAILLLLGLVARPMFLKQLSWPFIGLLLLMVLLPLLQLVPLPFSIWQQFPAQQDYAQALELALSHGGVSLENTTRAFSLVPAETEYALLALLPSLTIFLVCVGMTTHQLRALVPVFLAMATLQALIALAEYGIGRSANGTYVNRDHLAGFLEMALPVSLAMLAASFGQTSLRQGYHRSLRNRIRSFLYQYCNRTAIYAFISLSILLGLIFTQSRSGVALAMFVIVLSALAFSMRLGGRNVYGMVGTYSAVGLSLAVLIGLVPVLDRFVLTDHLQDARWSIYATMLRAINDFLPFGSGVGSFREVFARYHPEDITGVIVNRAHNDYLEWIMEGGAIAAFIIVGLLAIYALRWRKLLQGHAWGTFHFIQVGAGIGILAILLHSLVDFNLRIPANQIYFAFLAALFFHQAQESAEEREAEAPTLAQAYKQRNVELVPAPPVKAQEANAEQAGVSAPSHHQPLPAGLTAQGASRDDTLGKAPQVQPTYPIKPGPNPFEDQ